MKKIFYLLTFGICALSFKGNCQFNLVPNPSFELYTMCPPGLGNLPKASFWSLGVSNVTPEFFHACANSQLNDHAGVPQNNMGYQNARTGLGYAGICHGLKNSSTSPNAYREYIQTELIDSLILGVEYTISFYVSAGDSCGRQSNNFGAYFSTVEIDTVIHPDSNLPFQPQFENPVTNSLGDRIGWTLLSGTFIANGGEKFLILGNFRDSSSSVITNTGWGATNINLINSAYLYIDDVLVAPTDSLTSLNEINSNEELSLSTISSNEFEITSKYHPINSYEVVNCLGQIIDKKVNVNENSLQLNMQEFANGIYFIRVQLQNEKNQVFKISKH